MLLNHQHLTLQDSEAVAAAVAGFRRRPAPGFSVASLRPSKTRQWIAWTIVGVLALALVGTLPFVVTHFREAPGQPEAVRFTIFLPQNALFTTASRTRRRKWSRPTVVSQFD